MKCLLLISGLLGSSQLASETHIHGMIDARVNIANTSQSFLSGDYGKFRYSDGNNAGLAQAAIAIETGWSEQLDSKVILSAYRENDDSDIGINEAFFRYRTLPTSGGFRFQGKLGIMYPQVSVENRAYAWTSPYTLSFSAINSWIGEEVRYFGLSLGGQWLGHFSDSPHDVGLTLDVFQYNDTSGALLAWHGWNLHSQQTLWHRSVALPIMRVRQPGQPLESQAAFSDPFFEVDGRPGFHGHFSWRWRKQLRWLIGYYDNRAKPYVLKEGQYGWDTVFMHTGWQWQWSRDLILSGQVLWGTTEMQNPERQAVVNNTFGAAFLLASIKHLSHRWTLRLDYFDVADNDVLIQDDNHEYGQAATLNYQYRLKPSVFFNVELTGIRSVRPARASYMGELEANESLVQLGLRYYFRN